MNPSAVICVARTEVAGGSDRGAVYFAFREGRKLVASKLAYAAVGSVESIQVFIQLLPDARNCASS